MVIVLRAFDVQNHVFFFRQEAYLVPSLPPRMVNPSFQGLCLQKLGKLTLFNQLAKGHHMSSPIGVGSFTSQQHPTAGGLDIDVNSPVPGYQSTHSWSAKIWWFQPRGRFPMSKYRQGPQCHRWLFLDVPRCSSHFAWPPEQKEPHVGWIEPSSQTVGCRYSNFASVVYNYKNQTTKKNIALCIRSKLINSWFQALVHPP